jgi:hypothetical protein
LLSSANRAVPVVDGGRESGDELVSICDEVLGSDDITIGVDVWTWLVSESLDAVKIMEGCLKLLAFFRLDGMGRPTSDEVVLGGEAVVNGEVILEVASVTEAWLVELKIDAVVLEGEVVGGAAISVLVGLPSSSSSSVSSSSVSVSSSASFLTADASLACDNAFANASETSCAFSSLLGVMCLREQAWRGLRTSRWRFRSCPSWMRVLG